MTFTTRFAPSPTGPLHLGHAFSAMTAFRAAQEANGRFLLRIEDIDRSRARPDWEAQIYDDLAWLGLTWEAPVMRQSDRLPAYSAALDRLWAMGLLYPCGCRRRDILEALDAPQDGAPLGPDGVIYPGTCRDADRGGPRPTHTALRLDMAAALTRYPEVRFAETGAATDGETGLITRDTAFMTARVGDVVLSRRDMGTSYHLAVVTDDAAQGITHVIRGADLFEATVIHVLLQALLACPTPTYGHHALIRDDQGKRLAKRDDARAIARYRADGLSPAQTLALVGL